MNEMKSAVIVGTAYPYRGGLAGINQTLARTFIRCGIRCRIFTFTVQYPSFLFPGKSQYARFMKRYQDAQEEMNHEAVEFVRGISVIKVFGQSAWSIRKFRDEIGRASCRERV